MPISQAHNALALRMPGYRGDGLKRWVVLLRRRRSWEHIVADEERLYAAFFPISTPQGELHADHF